MTSLLWRIAKDVLWWGVPVAMVLLFTVGFYPMIAFSLAVGIGRAVLRHRSDRELLPPAMVALLAVGSVAFSPRATEAEEMLTVEISVCVDQRLGSGQDCSTRETIKMGLKCATCAGGAMACPSLVKAAIRAPTPQTIGLALGTCAAGAWACMECAEDLIRVWVCGQGERGARDVGQGGNSCFARSEPWCSRPSEQQSSTLRPG